MNTHYSYNLSNLLTSWNENHSKNIGASSAAIENSYKAGNATSQWLLSGVLGRRLHETKFFGALLGRLVLRSGTFW